LWSLAIVVFECLTGRVPFGGGSLQEVLRQVMESPVPSPTGFRALPEPIDAWWAYAAERSYQDRFQRARDMLDSLAAASSAEHVVAVQSTASVVVADDEEDSPRSVRSSKIAPVPSAPDHAVPSAPEHAVPAPLTPEPIAAATPTPAPMTGDAPAPFDSEAGTETAWEPTPEAWSTPPNGVFVRLGQLDTKQRGFAIGAGLIVVVSVIGLFSAGSPDQAETTPADEAALPAARSERVLATEAASLKPTASRVDSVPSEEPEAGAEPHAEEKPAPSVEAAPAEAEPAEAIATVQISDVAPPKAAPEAQTTPRAKAPTAAPATRKVAPPRPAPAAAKPAPSSKPGIKPYDDFGF
jgi:serine/threonine-protein kinase